jgi:NADH dehydrogenase
VVWAGGGKPHNLLSTLSCEHDKSDRIMTNNYLEVSGHVDSAMAVGDCACITDPRTGKPYPPTAQHALRQGKIAAKNLIVKINGQESNKESFNYKTKGVMTLIGNEMVLALYSDIRFMDLLLGGFGVHTIYLIFQL